MEYRFERGQRNVHTLTASYELLVKAFGDDGDNPRDDYKSMARWDFNLGDAEVYDYKVGKCYYPSGLEREQITEWHVQGSSAGIATILAKLTEAGGVEVA